MSRFAFTGALASTILIAAISTAPVAAFAADAAPAAPAATSAAPAKSTAKAHPMHKGSAEIMKLQEALVKNGATLKPDGKMGKQTHAAIKAFQKSHGLKVNGKFDAATKKALLG